MAIAQLVRDQQNPDEMLRRALERIIQLYTDKAHFIYELLQNAEDAEASVVKFHQLDDCLEVYHDGIPFTSDNLKRLCDIGISDKTENLNQIGEFGVGFKSVFGICERVRLYSQPRRCDKAYEAFAVEITDFTNPSDISFEPIPTQYTTKFVFPYCVGESFSGFKTIEALKKTIADKLNNLGVSTLLFMRHLNSIEYEIDCQCITGSGCYMLDETKITELCDLVTAIGATNGAEEELSYLKYSKIIPSMINRTVDIAYPVTIDKDGRYQYHKANNPYISVYFPTETESKISLIVQGPYRTTPNRSSISFDDEENIELARLTADLLHESILDIKAQGQVTLQLLNMLPIKEPEYSDNWLFKPFYDQMIAMFKNEDILPTADGTFVSGNYAKIARGQELINIFGGELLGELINDDDCLSNIPYKWLPGQLTENNKELSDLYSFLASELEIEVIRPEDLRNYLYYNDFLGNRDDTWLVQFYKYLEKNSNLVNRSSAGRNMLSIPFIKTADEHFVVPFRNGIQNVFMPITKNIEGFQFVHPFFAEQCNSFFTQVLHLTEPDHYQYFKKIIEKRYASGISKATDEEHIEDIKSALKYLADSKYKNDLKRALSKLNFIQCCKDDDRKIYVNPNYTDVYFEKSDEGVSAKDYFASDTSIRFVNMGFYLENDIDRRSLGLLGVKGALINGLDFRGWYYSGEGNAQWCDADDFRSNLDFVSIDSVINFIQDNSESDLAKRKSKIIMQLLFVAEKHLSGEIIKGKTIRNREAAHARIIDVLTYKRGRYYYSNTIKPKWLFDESGGVVNPSEISKYNLDKNIYGELKRDTNLYDILGFAHTQRDEMEETYESLACVLDKDGLTQNSILDYLLSRLLGVHLAEVKEKLAFVEKYKASLISYSAGNAEEYIDQDAEYWTYEFPSRPVKNLEKLRKSVQLQYLTAPKVKYEKHQRSIRVSEDKEKNLSYLKSMYVCEDNHAIYICQMCKNPFPYFEAVQIEKEPELELFQMHMLLCPNCAAYYRERRNDPSIVKDFMNELCEADENQDGPVCVSVGSTIINFTATHIAEIKEIQRLDANSAVNDGTKN